MSGDKLIHHGSGTAEDPDRYEVNEALLERVESGNWNTGMLKALVLWAREQMSAKCDTDRETAEEISQYIVHTFAQDGRDVSVAVNMNERTVTISPKDEPIRPMVIKDVRLCCPAHAMKDVYAGAAERVAELFSDAFIAVLRIEDLEDPDQD